ncbi:MAG: helix-turn-helix domain-containing protein [Planctomycetota bacterium]
MAAKFFELSEAAKILGVTTDQLMEMRQQGTIHGYRDGSTWKFKPEEVERVKADRSGGGDANSDDFEIGSAESAIGDEEPSDIDSYSLLMSDESRSKSAGSASNILADSSSIGAGGSSIISVGKGSSKLSSDDSSLSELKLSDDDSESSVFTGKDAELDTSAGGTGDLNLADDAGGDSGSLLLSNDLAMGESLLSLGEDSDDMVLGAPSGLGSDVSLDPKGSGINIGKPSESGLSLEEPLELGGSQMESLELPEDEEFVSLGDAASDPDSATMLKADEEFALGPQMMGVGDDSSDSGSQVIELTDSETFEDSAGTVIGPADMLGMGGGFEAAGAGALATGAGMVAMGAAAGGQPQASLPPAALEAPYSIWNVIGLLCVVMVMALTGVLMVDVLRNMWAFDSPYSVSSGVMDSLIEALKLD